MFVLKVFFSLSLPPLPPSLCLTAQIYTDWANHYLARSGHKRLIKDLQQDVADGVLLAEIIQIIGENISRLDRSARTVSCANVSTVN